MRELINEFDTKSTYIFRRNFINSDNKVYDWVDGMKVKILNKDSGYINRNGISIMIYPNMTEKIK